MRSLHRDHSIMEEQNLGKHMSKGLKKKDSSVHDNSKCAFGEWQHPHQGESGIYYHKLKKHTDVQHVGVRSTLSIGQHGHDSIGPHGFVSLEAFLVCCFSRMPDQCIARPAVSWCRALKKRDNEIPTIVLKSYGEI